jgi:hypothetical protein
MGRRTLLTPELEARICADIERGAFDYVAAEANGVGRDTFREWLARGEGRDPKRPSSARFAAFAAAVREARSKARLRREVAVAADDPLAWLMKGPGRERPGEPGWAAMQRHEGTGKDGEREPVNFKLVIEAPLAEHELFREWLEGLSPQERSAFDAKVRARAQARGTIR